MRLSFRLRRDDQSGDDRHIRAVKRAIASAIASVDLELQGVSRRVRTARSDAGALLGSENGLVSGRSEEDERCLRDAEGRLVSGLQRMSKLRQTGSILRDLEATVALVEGRVQP